MTEAVVEESSHPVDDEDAASEEDAVNPLSADMQSDSADSQPGGILVAYFSRTGNTDALAAEISRQTGGVLFEIVPAEPYPADYDATVERWRRENEEDARPAYTDSVERMADYDTIFVGYPIWGSDIPHIVRTFLEESQLSGKTVIPFCTHGGSRFGTSLNTLQTLCPDSIIADGFEVSGARADNCSDEVSMWIDGLGIVG